MESSSKPFQFHSCWEICKGWVLFEDPPQRAPTPVFGTTSSAADMDEDGSLTIQQTRVENPSSGEGSIPMAMGLNKAQRLKEKGKANHDYVANMKWQPHCDYWRSKMPLRRKKGSVGMKNGTNKYKKRKNMERNTSNYTSMSKTYFDRKKKEIMSRRQLFTSDYTPTVADDEDDVDYGY
ncbi:hypothetical protein D8674_010578 [Pyrus ussuriensis x Pyrus communis]|uniref:Uncharacterized protein n=1 Tax=Pyrus ussuriensis x Pyrus communis TaxID=2448454 RepID=A0A5N5FBF5_9ROSA|nr:hypothetical protein D8674_010578 [Pyrus ussuriensis x Pyrus communis]